MQTVADYETSSTTATRKDAAARLKLEAARRVAVVCDMREEGWRSMDLVADALLKGLREDHAGRFEAERVRPPMRRRFTRRDESSQGMLFNADRLVNRFWDYARVARRAKDDYDLFHVVDHSYSQLLHHLPPERTIVTCHDLDTFRSILEPERERRSAPFRMMTRRVLEGFRKAARVACDSGATRDEILFHKLLPPERLVVIPNGVSEIFSTRADAEADAEAARLLGRAEEDAPELLHVGSSIARKRIDVLLKVFASVRREHPRARLVRVGGSLNSTQTRLAEELNVRDAIRVLPYLDERVLAAVYRRAALVLQPSEREGFGLPLIEALACGTPVVASDITVLREVGGEEGAAVYRPVGDVQGWTEAVALMLRERAASSVRWAMMREAAHARASLFTWRAYVEKVAELYEEVLKES